MKSKIFLYAIQLLPLIASALLYPQAAHADNITGGSATVTFNNTAYGNSNPYGFYVSNTYDASANSTSLYASQTPPAGGAAWGPADNATFNLAINLNSVTAWESSIQRSLQATTFDPSTLSGQIGLSGGLWMLTPSYGPSYYLVAFDFDLVDKNGTWLLQSNDKSFSPGNPTLGYLQLTNANESYINGVFSLNGNLIWDPNGVWNSLVGADGSTIGSFSLTASAVPVPSTIWLFGSALAGFIGLKRHKTLQQKS